MRSIYLAHSSLLRVHCHARMRTHALLSVDLVILVLLYPMAEFRRAIMVDAPLCTYGVWRMAYDMAISRVAIEIERYKGQTRMEVPTPTASAIAFRLTWRA